ncbi:MAG: hypothetical protein ACJ780_06065, partial [Solirubrobacteraceae bacterium]
LDWWCIERAETFGAARPVYLSMKDEIRRVCGDDVYEELTTYCRARSSRPPRPPRPPRRALPLPITLLRPPRP